MTTEGTHAASQFRVASDNLTVTNDKGYRQAKASHGVAEGTWYYEATLTNTAGAARIGWSQISGDLQGPCGLDHYSYAFRSYPATRFHASVGYTYGERYDSPDVTLGVLIHLPPLGPAAREDLRRRRFILQRDFPYAKFDYVQPLPSTTDESDGGNTTAAAVSGGSPSFTSDLATEAAAPSPLPKMSGSAIVYFRNGRCLSQAYGPLHLGKYHPAVACYMGAEVRLNFGPEFAHPPPAEWEGTPVRPMSECPPENYLEDEAAAR
ncbi:transcription factor, contains a PHD finger motif [Tieghemiomyces parasiticus]|uniref:Transcription factor, contains a PHD finger motif n=1 Tax=Tieghemiomyces parasiticus TaxID=78921 RepID=A0A9W8DYZ7_9FUNG|nr:transcription factor, contains a PHD finger motif [Tieghemiomyces parasiticus]